MTRVLQTAGMAFSALFANRVRSVLTMLGIVIGVAAVILITSIGNGVQGQISSQLDELGPTNLITVSPGAAGGDEDGPGGGPGGPGGPEGDPFEAGATSTLTPEDARLVAGLAPVAAASPSVFAAAPVEGQSVPFTGVDPSYPDVRAVALAAGRFVEGSGELVLAESTAEDLLNANAEAAVGQTLGMWEEEYTVVGVSSRAEEASGIGPPTRESSYMTTDDALRILGTETVTQVVASAVDADSVDAATDEIRSTLADAHDGEEDFSVTTQEQLLSNFTQITTLLTYGLAGIAGISLLVAGIGVMNIMLVSVAERTREIGIRKALGATDGDILIQFLLEAVFLALIGGLTGIAVGIGVSALLPVLSANLPTAVTWTAVGLASGVSAMIGVVFGVLPAYRSARLQPVEALRRE
jgi:putative ABC transport system permease protein